MITPEEEQMLDVLTVIVLHGMLSGQAYTAHREIPLGKEAVAIARETMEALRQMKRTLAQQ